MIDGLPTLAGGAHVPGEGKACVMEYVALLAGEPWTDTPECTHPVLALAAQEVNDRLPDQDRHLLVPLIGRLFGTTPTGTDDERRLLAIRLAGHAFRSASRAAGVDLAHINRFMREAEAYCNAESGDTPYWLGFRGFSIARHIKWATVKSDLRLAESFAGWAAANAADAIWTSGDRKPADLIEFLSGLLDEYDRLTGRTEHRHVTDAELSDLARQVEHATT